MLTRRNMIRGSGLALGTGAILASGLPLGLSGAWAQDPAMTPRGGGAPVRLHYNENAAGCSPKVIEAMRDAMDESNLYPVKREEAYTNAVASYHSIAEGNVIRGNGSSEILLVTLLAAHQNAEWSKLTVFAPSMSFEVIADLCQKWKIPYVRTPMAKDLRVDLDALRSAAEAQAAHGPVMVYLTSPNNPTGDLIHSKSIGDWVKSAHENILFLIDEAYIDFVTDPTHKSAIDLVKAGYENLVVARTFSKVYGLAGVRVGYGIAATKIAESMNAAMIAGSNVNVLGLAAGVAALEDRDFYKASLASNRIARKMATDVLDDLGLDYVPGEANFIFHQIGRPHSDYQPRMLEHGFKVGRLMGGLQNWNRLSIGLPNEMERFADTLRLFRNNGWV